MNSWTLTFIWLMILLPPLMWEFHTIRNDVPGDTFSERTRVWFHTHTTAGRLTFIAVWAALAIWYPIHILHG